MSLSSEEVILEMFQSAVDYAKDHGVSKNEVRYLLETLLDDPVYRRLLYVLIELAEIGDAECPTYWAGKFIKGDKVALITKEETDNALQYFWKYLKSIAPEEEAAPPTSLTISSYSNQKSKL